jgi:tetratricopeptide (TPR) repeat protein
MLDAMRLARSYLACTLCMAVIGGAPVARAQPTPAKIHYEAGAQHYARGRYVEAIREFEEAYRLSSAAALLYNISQAYERLGDLVRAREYLQRYLATDAVAAEERGPLEDKLRVFDERIAAQKQAENAGPSTQPVAPPPPSVGEPTRPFRTWRWVALGAGGALLATAAFFAWDGAEQNAKIEDAAETGDMPYTYQGAWDRGERDNLLAWVTGGLGVAAVGAGVVFFVLDRRGSGEDKRTTASARFAPLAAPHAAGATLEWKW